MKLWVLDQQKQLWYLTCVVLLLAFFLQTCAALRVESATVDETIHFSRGYLYLALGDLHFKIGHPILANALNALPVWALADLSVPVDHPSWDTSWSVWSDRFVWGSGNDVRLTFTLGRLVTVALGLLAGCLVTRWARELFGPMGGVLALALYVFDPNILAHGHLVTDDTAVTGFTLAAVYGLWRFHKTRRWPSLVLSGVMLGCAQAVKYTAAVLIPLVVLLVAIWAGQSRRRLWNVTITLAAVMLVAGFTVWAVYGFQIGPVKEADLPFPVPAPDYIDDLIWQTRYMGKGHGAYLRGEISTAGWWYYDLFALAIKTPLPLLLLTLAAGVRSLRRRRWRPELLLPVAAFVAAASYSRVDIGLRYLLPAFPFLHVYAAQVVTARRKQTSRRLWTVAVSVALIWLVVSTAAVAPHYLAYFNESVGGPANGPLYLVDSNLDWGQALPSLRRWMGENNVDSVYLSYFGTAHPSAYGIDFTAIPTWEPAPEKGHPFQRVFVPSNPAPGYYAISATNLYGPTVPDRETLAWFRDRDPVARVGYAIYVFKVEPTGPPVNLALSGLQIDELSSETIAQFGTNDLRLRWFDARHSLVFPAREPTHVLVAKETPLASLLASRFAPALAEDSAEVGGDKDRSYRRYHLTAPQAVSPVLANTSPSPIWWSPATTFPDQGFERHTLTEPVSLGPVALLGYEIEPSEVKPGGKVTLLTYWQVSVANDRPLKLFAHLLDATGQVIAGQDRLDVPTPGWREGDVLAQVHQLPLAPDLPEGTYQLEIGWYDSQTMRRLPVYVGESTVADRVMLEPVVVSPR